MFLPKFFTWKGDINPIPARGPRGGADLPPTRANAYTRKNQWVEILNFCIFLNVC